MSLPGGDRRTGYSHVCLSLSVLFPVSVQVLCPIFFILIQSLPTPASISLPFMSFPEVTLCSFPYPSSTPFIPFGFFISPGVCGDVSHFVLFFCNRTPRCLLPPGHDQMFYIYIYNLEELGLERTVSEIRPGFGTDCVTDLLCLIRQLASLNHSFIICNIGQLTPKTKLKM